MPLTWCGPPPNTDCPVGLHAGPRRRGRAVLRYPSVMMARLDPHHHPGRDRLRRLQRLLSSAAWPAGGRQLPPTGVTAAMPSDRVDAAGSAARSRSTGARARGRPGPAGAWMTCSAGRRRRPWTAQSADRPPRDLHHHLRLAARSRRRTRHRAGLRSPRRPRRGDLPGYLALPLPRVVRTTEGPSLVRCSRRTDPTGVARMPSRRAGGPTRPWRLRQVRPRAPRRAGRSIACPPVSRRRRPGR